MKFTTNYEENKMGAKLVEQTEKVHRNGDLEVNILERTKSGGNELVEAECLDTTESSSSFDECDYGDECFDDLGEFEALSALDFDGFFDIYWMRRKKLTTHWRSFIKPLRWRCKWVELQIKKFEAEALKYERELDKYSLRKLVQLEKFALEENRGYFTKGSFMGVDLTSHATATQKVDIDDDFWGDDEPSCVEDGNGDDFLEDIFRKIDGLQSQVGKLKSRVDKIMTENAGKFSSPDNPSPPIPDNDLIDSPPSDSDSTNDCDQMPVGTYIAQLIAEYNSSEFLVPESAVPSHEEVVRDANSRTNHVYFADPPRNEDYGVLIDNPRVKEEMNSFDELKIQPIQMPVLAESNLPMNDQQPPKPRSIIKITTPERKKERRRGAARRVRFAI
ncbi:hypothetical protein DH2020_023398 [Rehmannia glutinosa]|uniref:Uncharacterized protein n=1 Tax=Rehmannia glutinosa TaxID=99300 RepID=A0ABR0WA38_REHGL